MAKHPSGKPIHKQVERKLSVFRTPWKGPLTPRLQENEMKGPFGFHPVEPKEELED